MSGCKRIAASMKRKATKSGHDFMYMLMWGEEPPKGKKVPEKRYK